MKPIDFSDPAGQAPAVDYASFYETYDDCTPRPRKFFGTNPASPRVT